MLLRQWRTILGLLCSLLVTGESAAETISLHKGWNLVSSSLQQRIAEKGAESIDKVVAFDRLSQDWSLLETVSSPAAHQGAWLHSSSDEDLQLSGNEAAVSMGVIQSTWMAIGEMGSANGEEWIAKITAELKMLSAELQLSQLYTYSKSGWRHFEPTNKIGDLGTLHDGDTVWALVTAGYAVQEDHTLQFQPLIMGLSDSSAVDYQMVEQAEKGIVRATSLSDDGWSYTPFAGAVGSDQFIYSAKQGGQERLVTVEIEIKAENDPPVVVNEAFSVALGEKKDIGDLLQNDSDEDGDTLTITAFSQPKKGTVTELEGRYYYQSNSDSAQDSGFEDTFTYTVSDGSTEVEGVVTILLTQANQMYKITGTILASAGTQVDGDVNHPDAACNFNGSSEDKFIQDISNPSTVGGYVRGDGGEEGRGRQENQDRCSGQHDDVSAGDRSDFYRVSLVKGQEVGLYLGDNPIENDIDLFVTHAVTGSVEMSMTLEEKESITVQESGDYEILVWAASKGASNYVLTVGQATVASSSLKPVSSMNLNTEFVPGEVVLRQHLGKQLGRRLSSALDTLSLEKGSVADPLQRSALYRVAKDSQGRRLYRKQDHTDQIAEFLKLDAEQHEKLKTIYMIKSLQKEDGVKYAEPNYILHHGTTGLELNEPNDQHYPKQWHYPMINLPYAWSMSTAENRPVVAVIDTGVLLEHPDLKGQLITGYDFIGTSASSGDGDGYDDNPNDDGDGDLSEGGDHPSSFHGTHVAGTIAAASNNQSGLSGVAWGAKIMPLRALGKKGGTSNDIEQAMRYAGGLENDSGTVPEEIADVINMSLGGPGYSSSNQEVITELRKNGITVVAAAGNSASASPFYPASYDGVISVSAVGFDQSKLAYYSNYGPFIDLTAPGGDLTVDANSDGVKDGILSTMGSEQGGQVEFLFSYSQGTSMASPHVAGVVALMRSVNPTISPEAVDALISSGEITQDLGGQGRDDYFGYGLIDAYKAVVAASQLSDTESKFELKPVLTVSPAVVNFGISSARETVRLSNSTGGELVINSVQETADWLKIEPPSSEQSGLGEYTLVVDRDLLEIGPHTTTVEINSSVGDLSLSVVVQKVSSEIPANAGYQTVLLINTETNEVRHVTLGDAGSNGEYDYSFEAPEGSYILVAGTDNDFDKEICDAGEACGAYPIYDLTAMLQNPIQINQDSVFDFKTSFDIRVRSSSSASNAASAPSAAEGFKLPATAP